MIFVSGDWGPKVSAPFKAHVSFVEPCLLLTTIDDAGSFCALSKGLEGICKRMRDYLTLLRENKNMSFVLEML